MINPIIYPAIPAVLLALSFADYRKIGGIHWLSYGPYRASICTTARGRRQLYRKVGGLHWINLATVRISICRKRGAAW